MLLAEYPEDPPRRNLPVRPQPILSEAMRANVMLVGQAPGLTEYDTGQPFSGGAGTAVRRFFADCGLPPTDFDRLVYQTSAVKCFPGRRLTKIGRSEDRTPSGEMLKNCSAFLVRQIAAVQPRVIVAMGITAFAERYQGTKVRLPYRAAAITTIGYVLKFCGFAKMTRVLRSNFWNATVQIRLRAESSLSKSPSRRQTFR